MCSLGWRAYLVRGDSWSWLVMGPFSRYEIRSTDIGCASLCTPLVTVRGYPPVCVFALGLFCHSLCNCLKGYLELWEVLGAVDSKCLQKNPYRRLKVDCQIALYNSTMHWQLIEHCSIMTTVYHNTFLPDNELASIVYGNGPHPLLEQPLVLLYTSMTLEPGTRLD